MVEELVADYLLTHEYLPERGTIVFKQPERRIRQELQKLQAKLPSKLQWGENPYDVNKTTFDTFRDSADLESADVTLTMLRAPPQVSYVDVFKNGWSGLIDVVCTKDKMERYVVISGLDRKTTAIVNFANKMIGSGFMSTGAVQEEMMFMQMPALAVGVIGMRMTPGEPLTPMRDDEAILTENVRRRHLLKGYGRNAAFDRTLRELEKYSGYNVIAMDALHFTRGSDQYLAENIHREVKKCLAGFRCIQTHGYRTIVTGRWGCGVFNGHYPLKAWIQMVVARYYAAKIGLKVTLVFAMDKDDIALRVFNELLNRRERKVHFADDPLLHHLDIVDVVQKIHREMGKKS